MKHGHNISSFIEHMKVELMEKVFSDLIKKLLKSYAKERFPE